MTRIESNIKNSIKLPLLLCRGTRSCMDAVHAIIARMFDCLITTLPAKDFDLRWLVPIIIMSANEEQQSIPEGVVQMIYTVPELPVRDTITVKFQTLELRKILTSYVHNVHVQLLEIVRNYLQSFILFNNLQHCHKPK